MKNILICLFLLINCLGYSQAQKRYPISLVDYKWTDTTSLIFLISTKKPITGVVYCKYGDMATYINGKIVSDLKEWYDNGQLRKIGYRTGGGIAYYENGAIEMEEFENGNRWRWYENGKLNSQRINGLYKSWDSDGILNQESYWLKVNNKYVKNGSEIKYYKNSQIMIETEYKNGKENGLEKQFNELGSLTSIVTYNDGVKELIQGFDLNGNLTFLRTYKGGVQNGIEKGFRNPKISAELGRPTNLLYYEYNFTNGELNGIQKDYYSYAHIAFEITYKNGIRDGLYKAYFENGNLEKFGNFQNNKEEGEWVFYDELGIFLGYKTYKNGERIK